MNEPFHPWISIWSHPRSTIRSITEHNPRLGFWVLATIYALALSFSTANFYSWGLEHSFPTVFFPLVILSPLMGFVWLTFQAFLLRLTGKMLGGKAPAWHIRAAVAWSRIPYVFALAMWLVLMGVHAETAFIQHTAGPTAVFVTLISLILHIWGIVLLIQLLREVQGFGVWKTILNVVIAWILSFIIVSIIATIGRYVYINYF